MNVNFQGLLIVLASVGIFFLLNKIARPLIRILLNGPLNGFYLDYLRSNTKLQFETASAADNPDQAWAELVFAKVYEMGSAHVSYSKREQNLQYIKESSLISKKLADELIKVLPKQYRNAEFQAKLACYICDLLSKLRNKNGNDKSQPITPIDRIIIDSLGAAISAWMAGVIYFSFSLSVIERFPPLVVLFSNLILFILMISPLFSLILRGLVKLTATGTIAAIIILSLGTFASVQHGKTSPPSNIDLTLYQNPGAHLVVTSPEYLTMDNVGCNGKKISVFVVGQLLTPIEFRSNNDRFFFLDKNCQGIIPRIEITQTQNQAYEFYIEARDNSIFYSETQTLTIIPQYVASSGVADFNTTDTINIQLENWFWNFVNNLSVKMGSIGLVIILYGINFALGKRTS